MTTQSTSAAAIVLAATSLSAPDVPAAELAARAPREHASKSVQVANLLGVIFPFLALIAAVVLLWGVAFNWIYLALLGTFYVLSGLGITIGYHRLFTHKSFSTGPVMTAAFAIMGSFAAQGSVLEWCSSHRQHHQHSDAEDDPHSPHTHGEEDGSLKGFFKGFFHAHVGWLLKTQTAKAPPYEQYVPDLMKDPVIKWVSKYWTVFLILGCIIPGIIAGLVTMSWTGFGLGILWGGLVRIFILHHVTWSINSVCHLWGARPYESHDESRNNAVFGILGLGEGWHNNHHAFPASARHGLAWWQFDASYIIIRAMEVVGLVSNVRVPTRDRLNAKLRKAA